MFGHYPPDMNEGSAMEPLTHTQQVQNLFVRNTGQIKGFILGLIPDFSETEDILQEVFMMITRQADEFELGTNFLAWAHAIARLKVKESYRRQKRLPYLLSNEVMQTLSEVVPEDEGIWERRHQALAGCLDAIAPKARRIMELRYVQGLVPSDIAEAISWSVGAVNVQLARSRKYLRECSQRKLLKENLP